MKDNEYSVSLPETITETFKLEDETNVILKVADQKIMIEPTINKPGNQTISLRWFLIPTTIASLGFFCYLFFSGYNTIPLVGKSSIANLVIVLGLLSGSLSFSFFFIQGKRKQLQIKSKDVYWRNFPTILLSFIIILSLSLLVFFKILGLVFKGATFDLFTATLLFFLFIAIVNYFMIYSALSITPSKLTNLLIFVIIGGVLLAMITNRDNQWWQFNFSFLGTSDAKHRWEFNLTLMYSALLMVALIDYLFVDLQHANLKNKRLTILRFLLTATALDLGAVGLFPYTTTGPFVGFHNQVAGILVYLIIILIISIRWLLPTVTKEFLIISYLIGGTLIAALYLFLGVGYLSLTVFELLAFMLAFVWILLLLQILQKMAEEANYAYHVTLKRLN